MLEHRLKLGTFLGIGLYVHWTFALLIAVIGYDASGDGWIGITFSILRLLGVFLCVTLHEYGHAIAARRYDIPTLDITLLPIGGVARLLRMPRVPTQELVVAVAGPAVNVVIILMLGSLMLGMYGIGLFEAVGSPTDERSRATAETLLSMPTLMGFLFSMLLVNATLVLFNMIPAFPMDGGRVLRAVLAMAMPYRRATYVASRIGLICAMGMVLVAFRYHEAWMLVAIAAFISYAGIAESRQVDVMETIRGLNIANSMIAKPASIDMNTPLADVAARWQSVSLSAMPVLSITGGVVGMLYLDDVARAIRENSDSQLTAGMLANHAVPSISIDDELETVLLQSGQSYRQMPVVDRHNRLVGVLDLDSMMARGTLDSVRPRQRSAENAGFDVFS